MGEREAKGSGGGAAGRAVGTRTRAARCGAAPLVPPSGTKGTEGQRSVCLGAAIRVRSTITPESVRNVITLPGTDGRRALPCRRRGELQVRALREGVRLPLLPRQTPQVHALRGPGRQEIPLPPLQPLLREEGPAAHPRAARPRETQTPQGETSPPLPRGLWGEVFCPPDRSQRCPSRVEAVGHSGSPKRRTRREPLPRRHRTRCGVGRGNGTGKGWGLPVRHRHALLLRSPTPSFVLIFKILFLRCLIFRQRPFSWNR